MHNPIITLTVANPPGVLCRISGLFARRNYNLDGVFVEGLTGTDHSCMILRVKEDLRMPQVIKQLEKLHDVLEVSVREETRA